MTPAIRLLEKAKVAFKVHEYHHDPAAESFGDETVAALGLRRHHALDDAREHFRRFELAVK